MRQRRSHDPTVDFNVVLAGEVTGEDAGGVELPGAGAAAGGEGVGAVEVAGDVESAVDVGSASSR